MTSPGPADRPAKQLLGKVLDGNWRVVEMVPRSQNATGGRFSQCYIVESDTGGKAFLKALDYVEALASSDAALALQAMTEAYNFERNLLNRCEERRMDRIVQGLASGSIQIGGSANGVVQYLILELADGDVRNYLARFNEIELAWVLRCLHHVATGLMQLHSAGMAHQDLKPSNILIFDEALSKIADLGRAVYQGHISPHESLTYAGDPAYAPPELLYGFVPADWRQYRLGRDLYLLGSMVPFFFTGIGVTGLLMSELPDTHQPHNWTGAFQEVLPYLQDAFARVIVKLDQTEIPKTPLGKEIKAIVAEL